MKLTSLLTPTRPRLLCLLAALVVSTLPSCSTSSSSSLPAEYWIADIYDAGLGGKNPASALTFAR
jgi:hypothetical protein